MLYSPEGMSRMGKADIRLSDAGKSRPRQISGDVLEPVAPSRTADPNASRIHPKRFGLMLMVASSVLTLALIGLAWVMLGRLL